MKESMDQALQESFFGRREKDVSRLVVDKDMLPYEYLKNGDEKAIKECGDVFRNAAEGRLSEDDMRDGKYRFVESAILCVRYAIEGGLDKETAYLLHDSFVKQADLLKDKEFLCLLHDSMIREFLKEINGKKERVYSRPVLRTMDYVDRHLSNDIRLLDVAEEAGVSPNYLSGLFVREVGVSLSRYVRKRRVDASKVLLRQYRYSVSEISGYLHFSSPSHFSKVFREEMGMTPLAYSGMGEEDEV